MLPTYIFTLQYDLPSSCMENNFFTAAFGFYFWCHHGITKTCLQLQHCSESWVIFQFIHGPCRFWLVFSDYTPEHLAPLFAHISCDQIFDQNLADLLCISVTSELLNSYQCTQTSENFQCFHWFLWVFGGLNIRSLCMSLWLPKKFQCH
jgi:hypothetical protein